MKIEKIFIIFILLFQTFSPEWVIAKSTPIDEAVSVCFPQLPKDAVSATQLRGGYSGDELFLIDADGKHYALRLIQSYEDPLRCQKAIYAMLEASKAGIGPHIHFVSQDSRMILMDYIEGGTLTLEQSQQSENRIKIVAGLRKAHATERNPYAKVTMLQRTETLFQKNQERVLNKQDFTEAFHLVQQSFDQLSKINSPRVNIHGDLSPRNIFISNNQVFFIDWFNTYWEDPFLDLTYFAIAHDLGSEEEQTLLKEYLQRSPTSEEQTRFQLVKKINLSRLCILLNLLVSDGQKVDTSAPLKDYSYYIRLLTAHNVELSSQYFYEVSQILLQRAKLVKVPEM